MVARPDGPHEPPARRADDARLARLVRDLRGREQRAPDDPPEQPLSKARPRLVPDPADRRDLRSGDAALALGHGEHEGLAERELRPRADGAVHHRRRPRRLHRARRPRAGPRADGLAQRLEREPRADPLPLRQAPARPRREADLRQARPLRLARLVPALRPAPPSPVVLRYEALELLRADPAARGDEALARAAVRRSRARDRPGRRGDPQAPGALRRTAHGEAPGRLRRRVCCVRFAVGSTPRPGRG